VSPRARSGWLDSLARWSVGGRDAGRPPGAATDVAAAEGTTRRTALRSLAGAGAVAILSPMRLLEPTIAAAATTQLAECLAASNESAYVDAEACLKGPQEEFLAASDLIDEAKRLLRRAKSAAERRRLTKVIAFQNRRRREALRDMGFCNKSFLSDRAEGDAKCQTANPPPSGETGGGGTGGNGGCEPGFLLCNDYCCNTNNAYCQGCTGKVVCCRIEADCCPSG
jgi:hypothetical protein